MKKKIKSNYSISKVLREKGKSNDYFEILLANISLEELIALKLELGYKAIGFPLHGYPIWRSINYISKEAILLYSLASTGSKREAARLLGLQPIKFFRLLKKYKIRDYFSEEKMDDNLDARKVEKNIS
jgi:hypothetical protein